MLTHTLVFSFPDEMSEADREEFFREGSALVLGSGLAESYEHRPNIVLEDSAAEAAPPIFVASAIAHLRCRDVDAMRKLFAYAPLGDFVRRWRARFPYDVVSVNTAD